MNCLFNRLSSIVLIQCNVSVRQLRLRIDRGFANNRSSNTMKVLNVAEKNDAAKNIAMLLGRRNCDRREGLSTYNKIYEFNMHLFNQECQMIMTSVSGHLLGYEFVGTYQKWHGCHPFALFDAPVVKQCVEDTYIKIKKTLEREIKKCGALIIWTDCDREGENIGFEIIEVCKAVKPNIRIYRAKFSEITQASVQRAIDTLGNPNKAVSDAVDVRSELDLRIGAAFTRFQTLRLQKVFPQTLTNMLISYGSCQFPTLGFVVERFLAIERFQSEPYWKIKVTDDHDDICVEFRWARNRLFEELPCQILLDICQEQPHATVEKITSKPKSKWRPLPLDTIELEKQGSRKLRLNAKQTMKIAEKLYTQGFISYPRTETNIFPKELNLTPLVQQQVNNPVCGEFAQRVLDDGISPRQGKKSDQAHPPIHPTKLANGLQGDEARVYEFVVRHFLACLAKNAEGHETIVEIDIADEKFAATGLQILAKNYLDVYIYEKWNAKEIHMYQQGQVFTPTSIDMVQENTSPPNLLTEADLIALMDKHGIGTDATHADHIDTIKNREYVGLTDGTHFIPGKLGIGLVMGYDSMGFQMSKPNLRAELECDLQAICEGRKDPKEVLQRQINKYRDVFRIALERANLIDTALANYLDERPTAAEELENVIPVENPTVFKCPRCGNNMTLKDRRQGTGKYIGCTGYPTCNNAVWLPQDVLEVEVLNDICNQCPGDMHKLKVKLKPGAFPILGTLYTACIGGCDRTFNEMLNIKDDTVRRIDHPNDSGYGSANGSVAVGLSGNSTRSAYTLNNTRGQSQIRGTTRGRLSGGTLTSSGRGGSPAGSNRGGRGGGSSGGTLTNRGGRGGSGSLSGTLTSRGRGGSSGSSSMASSGRGRGAGASSMATNQRPTASVQNRENLYPSWGSIDDDVILCDCHEIANQRTVSKEGVNKGRLFYVCAKPRDAQCKFFMWATDVEDQGNNAQANQPNPRPPPSFNRGPPTMNGGGPPSAQGTVTCTCGQPAVQRVVRKEGPNTGRKFWTCPQGPGGPCNFFEWADEPDETDGGFGGGWAGPGPRAGGSQRGGGYGGRGRGHGAGSSRPQGGGAKRKCGLCGTEGHTRRTCPQNSMD